MSVQRNLSLVCRVFSITSLRLFILISGACVFANCYAYIMPENIHEIIRENTSQNILEYSSTANNVSVTIDTNKLRVEYLKHFFSPWQQSFVNEKLDTIKTEQVASQTSFLKNPAWGSNANRHSQLWVQRLVSNSNLVKVPNLGMRGIITCDTNVRTLPTHEPVLTDWLLLRKGYPFDRMQESLLKVGTPIYIANVSRDGAWYFIITASYAGWIPSNDAGFVDNEFAARWKRSIYVAALYDDVSLYDSNWRFMAKANIGNIYPLYKETRSYYQILLPVLNVKHYAQSRLAYLPKKYAAIFPVPSSTDNMAVFINRLVGQPYGWGGMYGLRDCSALMMDLFVPFGIWLPRNSGSQIQGDGYIDLAKLSRQKKIKAITEYGVPFFTILHLPGHVGLYLGKKDGELYMFHNTWGFKNNLLNAFLQKPRKIVGRAVITSLKFGRTNFYSDDSVLDKIKGMRVLTTTSRK